MKQCLLVQKNKERWRAGKSIKSINAVGSAIGVCILHAAAAVPKEPVQPRERLYTSIYGFAKSVGETITLRQIWNRNIRPAVIVEGKKNLWKKECDPIGKTPKKTYHFRKKFMLTYRGGAAIVGVKGNNNIDVWWTLFQWITLSKAPSARRLQLLQVVVFFLCGRMFAYPSFFACTNIDRYVCRPSLVWRAIPAWCGGSSSEAKNKRITHCA